MLHGYEGLHKVAYLGDASLKGLSNEGTYLSIANYHPRPLTSQLYQAKTRYQEKVRMFGHTAHQSQLLAQSQCESVLLKHPLRHACQIIYC